jgi:hypothetical protein
MRGPRATVHCCMIFWELRVRSQLAFTRKRLNFRRLQESGAKSCHEHMVHGSPDAGGGYLKRKDLAFPAIFVLSGLFILACGTTHVMGVWTLWYPDYRLDGGIKAVTAVLSVGTAVAIWKVMPHALALTK